MYEFDTISNQPDEQHSGYIFAVALANTRGLPSEEAIHLAISWIIWLAPNRSDVAADGGSLIWC